MPLCTKEINEDSLFSKGNRCSICSRETQHNIINQLRLTGKKETGSAGGWGASPSLCRQQERGDKKGGWAWRGAEFCLRASLGLSTVNKVQKQATSLPLILLAHGPFALPGPGPGWPRHRQVTLLGAVVPAASSRQCPAPALRARLISRALSARSPDPAKPASWKVQGAWDPAGPRAPQAAQGSSSGLAPRAPDPPAPARRRGGAGEGGARADRAPGRPPGCLVPHL